MEDFKSKVIFIVDDTAFMRTGMVKYLIELGCKKENLLQFENGQEALSALDKSPPHLIFSDWNMPLMNGLEFLKKIRASDHPTRNVPVVMVTTVSEKDKVIEALQFNLSGYILKPVAIDKLKKTLNDVFLGEDLDE